jgi:hypothetical protein
LIQKACEDFVLLRMTYLRGVNLSQFRFDYDLTWMAFFLDADGRIYSRYGSRNAVSADSHNSAEGLLHTMREVRRLHREASARPQPTPASVPEVRPGDIPALTDLGYGASCVRCHMVHEALVAQKRKDGTFRRGDFWLYPPPENVGVKLDLKRGNRVREVLPDSFAARAGLKTGDELLRANGTRVLSVADFQQVLNDLPAKSRLTIEADRAGKPVKTVLALSGDWKRSDGSWRKSIRQMSRYQTTLARSLAAVPPEEQRRLGIAEGQLALRVTESEAEVHAAGLCKDDIVVAFDGQRRVPYRRPEFYLLLEHQRGDRMRITFLRDGKEQTVTLLVP